MATSIPAYFEFLVRSFNAGRSGRDVHLGFWDDPPPLTAPVEAGEFEAAQKRLTALMIELARLEEEQRLLDIGCGFGGTLEAAAKFSRMRLVGVNIDARQLDICRSLSLGTSSLSLIAADACGLPVRDESFDVVLCVEAMFHFRSRREFLSEAARVLRPGGRLALSDILLRRPGEKAPLTPDNFERTISDEYGPWPALWIHQAEWLALARQAGFKAERVIDATRQTLPSYRVTAPEQGGDIETSSAGHLLRWLHDNGCLTYLCASLTKT